MSPLLTATTSKKQICHRRSMTSVLSLTWRRGLITREVCLGGIAVVSIIFIKWTGKVTPKSKIGSKVYMVTLPVVPGQDGDFYLL